MGKKDSLGLWSSLRGKKGTTSTDKLSSIVRSEPEESCLNPHPPSDQLHFDGGNTIDLVKERFIRRRQWMNTNRSLVEESASLAEKVRSCLRDMYGPSVEDTFVTNLSASFRSANLRLDAPVSDDVPRQAKIIHGAASWLRKEVERGEVRSSDAFFRSRGGELSRVMRGVETSWESDPSPYMESSEAAEELRQTLKETRSELDAIYRWSERGGSVPPTDQASDEAGAGNSAGTKMTAYSKSSNTGFWAKTALATTAAAAPAWMLYRHYREEDTE